MATLVLRGQRGRSATDRLSLIQVDRLVLGRTVAQGTLQLPDQRGRGRSRSTSAAPRWTLAPRWAVAYRAPAPGQKANRRRDRHGRWMRVRSRADGRNDRRHQRCRCMPRTMAACSSSCTSGTDRGARTVPGARSCRAERRAPSDRQRRRRWRAAARPRLCAHDAGRDSCPCRPHYDDRSPGRPLTGTMDITDFRIRDAPVLGKLLQAMTLYGLVEVMRGPGLGSAV